MGSRYNPQKTIIYSWSRDISKKKKQIVHARGQEIITKKNTHTQNERKFAISWPRDSNKEKTNNYGQEIIYKKNCMSPLYFREIASL